MITFVATRYHRGYLAYVQERLGARVMRTISYDSLFARTHLRSGTWIFGDLDRLGFWELELAAKYYRALASAGAVVLNDPALVLQRGSLLKQLHAAGLNSFAVWRLADGERPDRYPVFLRTEAAHRGKASDLVDTLEALEVELARLLEKGIPLRDLLAVEYRAQELADRPGAFRKHAAYAVAGTIVPAPIVTDVRWHAKHGTIGTATEAHYEFEREYNQRRPHSDHLLDAFRIARIDFGRVDYAVVDDRPEIYEINTNPRVRPQRNHHSQTRLETDRLALDQLVAAFAALDRPSGGRKPLALDLPKRASRFRRRFQISRWVP